MRNPLPYAVVGDMTILVSFALLGGDFWDKLGALFIYDAKVFDDIHKAGN
jgi:hypothetical protein